MRDALGQNCRKKIQIRKKFFRSLWEFGWQVFDFFLGVFGATDLSLETATRLRRCLAKGCHKKMLGKLRGIKNRRENTLLPTQEQDDKSKKIPL